MVFNYFCPRSNSDREMLELEDDRQSTSTRHQPKIYAAKSFYVRSILDTCTLRLRRET